MVDTALVALVESGRVRVHAPGELAAERPDRRHPVEAAVLDAVGTQGHRSVDTIRWRLAGDERLADLGRSLAAAGLLRRTLRGRKAWSPTRAGRQALDRAATQPPADRALDGGSALLVALKGREAMPDAELPRGDLRASRATGGPQPRVGGATPGCPPAAELRRPGASRRTRPGTPLGGAAAIGFIEGGAGDGGGF